MQPRVLLVRICIYSLLTAVAIPWYWPPGDTSVWFGLPAWVTVSILAGLAASIYTVVLLMRSPHYMDD